MKIGILGSRGIPNRYGGFEQLAEFLSAGLARKGHEVYVYNSSRHPFREDQWRGVHIIRCRDPEHRIGTAGQFLYDLHCVNDSRRRDYDVLLHLGYTSDSIWHRRWPKKTVHLVNMDGLEWKRSKYGPLTRRFLRTAESLAARHADRLIADSPAIRHYLFERYGKKADYIAYGATLFEHPDSRTLRSLGVENFGYSLLLARMEPENNIETVIRGYLASKRADPLLIVSNLQNRYGKRLVKTYRDPRIRFTGAIYDMDTLNNLRHYSSVYFHGHSVGGTNPSLLEAMACGCRILAHENLFNKAVLPTGAAFFSSEKEITAFLDQPVDPEEVARMQEAGKRKIESEYNWEKIINLYESAMLEALSSRR